MKVLVVDDDSDLADAMRTVLRNYSIELTAAPTPEEGMQLLREESFDLLLLDVMLPEVNGFELCRRIRMGGDETRHIPIIMLTARTDLTDLVVGLETGADDYVTKPFEPRELVARIHAVQRRAAALREERQAPEPRQTEEVTTFQLDGTQLLIDPVNARVHVDQTLLTLTSMEYELLVFLAKEPGRIFSRDDLITAVQGISRLSSRSIDALVYRLRLKMRTADERASFIRTIRSRGYSLIGQRLAGPPLDSAAG